MKWLALDIGGANIKVSDGIRHAQSYYFELWKQSAGLSQQLRMLIAQAPATTHLAVTMTGELADCFENKTDGVQFILDAVDEASDGRHIRIYLADGRLVSPQVARTMPLLAAASNWHVLARYVGRLVPDGPALLVDIGSTTTDIIPLVDGQPTAVGITDTERLLNHELVYSGVERSPVCALVETTPWRGRPCPVAQEFFATTVDVYVVLGALPEGPNRRNTADGKPATKRAARIRLGRMICAEDENFNHKDAVAMAHAVCEAQTRKLAKAVEQVISTLPGAPAAVILSGHGEFLARRVLDDVDSVTNLISMSKRIGVVSSRSATAHALAVIATESVQ